MTTEFHTLEDSASGKNAHYVACKIQQQSVAYCACLHRQKVIDSGESVPGDWSACRDASRNSSCRALHMRHEEVVAGQALYFKPREQFAAEGIIWKSLDRKSGIKPGVLTMIKPGKQAGKTILGVLSSAVANSTYAAAVTAAAQEHPAQAPAPEKIDPPQPEAAAISGAKPQPAKPQLSMQPGESAMDFIRRLRASQSAVATA